MCFIMPLFGNAPRSLLLRLPLPEVIPEDFRMLPEYFLEDVVDYYIFVMRLVLSEPEGPNISLHFIGRGPT